ncbi:MAG: hypothetical protein ACK4K0_08105 [Flavobacteriales bacterium]
MDKETYTKDDFFGQFKDLTVFDCGKFNLSKVVIDSFFRKIGNKHTSFIEFDKPELMVRLLRFYKRITSKRHNLHTPDGDKKIIAIVPARYVSDSLGETNHLYLERIYETIGIDNLLEVNTLPKVSSINGYNISEIYTRYNNFALSSEDKIVLQNLKRCYKSILYDKKLSTRQLKDLKAGFDRFWKDYKIWCDFLRKHTFQKAILIPGYQTEAIIAALKSNNVEVIELQHGVISPSSNFHVYPEIIKPVASRALFPDKVWLFGSFWRLLLLEGYEYEAGQLEVIGDYFYKHNEKLTAEQHAFINEVKKFKKVILIGTQYRRTRYFIDYISNYLVHHIDADTVLVIKPHPLEEVNSYLALEKHHQVKITTTSLDALYPIANVYVSIYSNTYFEASKYKHLTCFALYNEEWKSLIDDIVQLGVAHKLLPTENPLSKVDSIIVAENKEAYFESFDPGLLKNLIC